MTLNAIIGVLWISWRFRVASARHISKANCTEINWDRHGQAAYEIFSIERRFRRSKTQFSRFKETCTRGHQRAEPPYKSLFLQIGMGMLSLTTSTSDEFFSRINIDDFKRPWTSRIRGFYWFLLRSSAAAHAPRMNCDEMAGTPCFCAVVLYPCWNLVFCVSFVMSLHINVQSLCCLLRPCRTLVITRWARKSKLLYFFRIFAKYWSIFTIFYQ